MHKVKNISNFSGNDEMIFAANNPAVNNGVYLVNVSTRKFYTHIENQFLMTPNKIILILIAVLNLTVFQFIGNPFTRLDAFIIEDITNLTKIVMLLVVVTIIIVFQFLFKRMNINKINYFKLYPDAGEVTSAMEINLIHSEFQKVLFIIFLTLLILLIVIVAIGLEFWFGNNLGAFIWLITLSSPVGGMISSAGKVIIVLKKFDYPQQNEEDEVSEKGSESEKKDSELNENEQANDEEIKPVPLKIVFLILIVISYLLNLRTEAVGIQNMRNIAQTVLNLYFVYIGGLIIYYVWWRRKRR